MRPWKLRPEVDALDAHDNLRQSLKHVADEVALWLGVPDNDSRITWQYAQRKCARGEHGVEIRWVQGD